MNKFLITLATLVAFTLSGFAYAQTVSGQMQRIIGVGDDVDGGVSEQFTRFVISTEKTADNGWVIGGSMSIQTAAATGGTYAPSTNFMYVQTDMMTVNIGNTIGPAITSVPAVNGMVPGGGVDAGYQFLFDGGNLASQGVQFREAYYASNAAKIDIDLPSVNGFTVGVSYTPDSEFDATTQSRATNTVESAAHGEVIEVAAKYDGEMEGLSYTIGVAALSGNSQSTITGQAARSTINEDLSSFSAGIKVTMGNMSIGLHGFDNGASFGASSDDDKARHNGWNSAITWAMGNLTLGVGYSHQENVRGTRAMAAITGATGAAGDVAQDNITMVGLGYDMGGGISTYVQLSNNNHEDGNVSTNEVNPQVLFAGINIGF
ncbi:MAG: porin [Alphaproteobacteria bacterium]|nr:porin [Alphaproteobacteria bacterium]